MYQNEEKYFVNNIKNAYKAYSQAGVPDGERLHYWFGSLMMYSFSAVSQAIELCAKECKYPFGLPDILERVKLLSGEDEEAQKFKAEKAMQAFLRDYSNVNDFIFEDWKAAFALRNSGRPADWDTTRQFEVNQLKKRFISNYVNAERFCPDNERTNFVGGNQNGPVRFVNFIGNYDACLELAKVIYNGLRFSVQTPNPHAPAITYKSPDWKDVKGLPTDPDFEAKLDFLTQACKVVGKDLNAKSIIHIAMDTSKRILKEQELRQQQIYVNQGRVFDKEDQA